MCILTHTIKTTARITSSIIILIFKLLKIFEMPLLFRELFREKSKKDRCGGTQERKMNARKQRKGGKTTVNC